MKPTQEKFYRPELDILRFLAFFLVFLRHTEASIAKDMYSAGGFNAFLANFATGGSYGVDLFFLLSAYLITELFVREQRRSGAIDIPAFYLRRILRIWPLYFLFIFSMFALSRFTQIQFPDAALLPMLLFYGNWYLMTHAFFSPAGILWSVSIEEQFYLFCPLAVRFLSRTRLIILCLVLILTANLARFALLKTGAASALWFCTFTRLDPIATGILICLLLRGRTPTFGRVGRVTLLIAGLSCFYVAATWFHGVDFEPPMVGGMIAYPLADAGALMLFLAFLGAQIAWRPLVYLGQISYGLYVYHLLALDVAKVALLKVTGDCPFWERGAIGLSITIVLAAVSYSFLEKPFLKLKDRLVPARRPAPALL